MIDDIENLTESSSGDSDIDGNEADGVWDTMGEWNRRGVERRQQSTDESAPETKVHLVVDIDASLREALQQGMVKQGDMLQ
jgi:hypothetical protein